MILGQNNKTVQMVRLKVPNQYQQQNTHANINPNNTNTSTNNNNNNVKQINNQQQPQTQRPCLWYILSWVLFIIAIGIYCGIWAISKYAVTIQSSYYYNISHSISPYIEINSLTNTAGCNTTLDTSLTSTSLYTSTDLTSLNAVALSLVFSWLMWKLPLCIFILHLIYNQQNRILKYVTWSIAVVLMLAADICLTIFINGIYTEYMFYGFGTLLAVIVSIVNNRNKIIVGLMSSLLPLVYIALLYFSYTYFIPTILQLLIKYIDPGYTYIIIYGYPILDLIFYSLLLVLNCRQSTKLAKPMLSFIQFYIIGYSIGITMLASMTQVEFYYLVGYMLFRNFFSNWVMYKWENVVNNPPCLPGWGIVYYLSYIFNFVPVIGIGRLVISKSFVSQQFSQACLLLSYYIGNNYPYSTATPTVSSGFNFLLQGYIFWPAALIIWVISTVTQKYPRRKPTLFDLFYNLGGIYMFYLGISAGLQLLTLRQVGLV